MREIKFRAWCKRRWLHEWEWGLTADGATLVYDQDEDEWTAQNKECPVYDLSICQFTGLKDKNGKDIYEGDIIKLKGNPKPVTTKIEYLNGCFGFWYPESGEFWTMLAYNFIPEWSVEVIGNIYENPELIAN